MLRGAYRLLGFIYGKNKLHLNPNDRNVTLLFTNILIAYTNILITWNGLIELQINKIEILNITFKSDKKDTLNINLKVTPTSHIPEKHAEKHENAQILLVYGFWV